jgi:hypothetical protein
MSSRCVVIFVAAVALVPLAAPPVMAQYNSGSSGVHGVFPPVPVPAARYMLWDVRTGLLRFCSAYDTALRPDTCTTEVSTAQIPGIPPGGLTTGVFEFSAVDVPSPPTFGALDIFPVGYHGPIPLTILSRSAAIRRSSAPRWTERRRQSDVAATDGNRCARRTPGAGRICRR